MSKADKLCKLGDLEVIGQVTDVPFGQSGQVTDVPYGQSGQVTDVPFSQSGQVFSELKITNTTKKQLNL
ncbi:MAG: hypothetical protein JNM67_04135 [Bacteroidetes bacterium]|nr:hypothetical protein [Bacteroidota bacterium]